MPLPELARDAGLNERDLTRLQETHAKLRKGLKIAQASARCGGDCEEMLTDLHSLLDQVTSLLREFFDADPREQAEPNGD